ncbi:HEPN domain-containing protein [Methylocystis sp.]|uniref:HEPN domain-containing protein n=1 Tax=Methylocystis sp. TaxID=1911079 RepID=UPI003DA6BCC0
MAGAKADDWWRQAKSELETARLCKANGKSSQAYFHAGQAIEFLLKALFLKRNNLSQMPNTHKGAHWHDLQSCGEAARIGADLFVASKAIRANWLTVRDWRSNGRFPDLKVSKQELNDLFVAVCSESSGVWQWLESIYLKS